MQDAGPTSGPRALRGAAEGVIATAAMTAVFGAAQGLNALHKPPPEQIVEAAAAKTDATPPPPPAKGIVVWLAHFGFGAAMGALFRLLRPKARALEGVAFGVALWGVSYQGLLPAARLFPPASRDDTHRQTVNVLAHVVYGLVLGVQAGTRSRSPASS